MVKKFQLLSQFQKNYDEVNAIDILQKIVIFLGGKGGVVEKIWLKVVPFFKQN